jgi:DNA-binding transcriptional MerR regulator
VENRYTNQQAADRIGVTKNTLYRWEKRKAAGDPRYKDFPVPPRVAHSNHRFYTDERIDLIIAWKNQTSESAA